MEIDTENLTTPKVGGKNNRKGCIDTHPLDSPRYLTPKMEL